MAENVSQLINEHRAFYEVTPYYVVVEDAHGTPAATRSRIQAGFDVDIYGEITSKELPPPDYPLAIAVVKDIADAVAQHTNDSCSIRVIPFPSMVVLDTRDHLRTQARLRIRISHSRGLSEPSGVLEERALREIEDELKKLRVPRH
jgi:hypothetical protein